MNWPPSRDSEADVSSASPSSEPRGNESSWPRGNEPGLGRALR